MEIILEGDEKLPAHKFVLNARSTKWNLNNTNLLDWSHLPKDVGMAILSWIYNDQVTTTLLEPLQISALTKKSSTSLWNRGPLKVLNDAKLILNKSGVPALISLKPPKLLEIFQRNASIVTEQEIGRRLLLVSAVF